MISSNLSLHQRTLRAPRENGAILAEPPLVEIGGLVAENLQLRQQQEHYDVQGRTLGDLSRLARQELLRDARRWTAAYRDLPPAATSRPEQLFLAGHQPQLFHPGVWFKNFALGHLAKRHGAVGVNLVIDSDTIKTAALRVPSASGDGLHAAWVPLDQSSEPIPYEERKIRSRGMFADFAARVMQQLGGLVPDALLRSYWPLAVQRARQTDNLGACLAQSRHQLEGRWGLETLEVPQSRVFQSESFAHLAAHLLAQLPRFRTVYNEAVQEYRDVHGIRGAAQPVPDLAAEGEWLEAPFWIWTAADPIRRPLFARRQGKEIRLTDHHRLNLSLPLSAEGDAARAVARLLEISCRGVKLRGRALVTTLWSRLALGDVFLHGIGGAKYDQVTDAIIERFFGLRPPGFAVVSATLLLPGANGPDSAESLRAIDRRLRDLTWNPQRCLEGDDQQSGSMPQELLAAKRRWIETPATSERARTRCHEIRRINEALQPWVTAQRQQLLAERQRTARRLRMSQVLAWREYGFCLYPEGPLREFLTGIRG